MPPRGFVIDLGKDAQPAVATADGDDGGNVIPRQKMIQIVGTTRVRSGKISVPLKRCVGEAHRVTARSQRPYAVPDGVGLAPKRGRGADGAYIARPDRPGRAHDQAGGAR